MSRCGVPEGHSAAGTLLAGDEHHGVEPGGHLAPQAGLDGALRGQVNDRAVLSALRLVRPRRAAVLQQKVPCGEVRPLMR